MKRFSLGLGQSVQAVLEITDNILGQSKEGHVYIKPQTRVGASEGETADLLVLRDCGPGMDFETWQRQAIVFCRTTDHVNAQPGVKQGLGRHGRERSILPRFCM